MGKLLEHRGPDRLRFTDLGQAALGSQRLRIVDLRDCADSPFEDTRTGTYLVCNGEIYNARELRREMSDYRYRSDSDIEVILPVVRAHGIEGIARLDGMFAIALWSERERTLTLARDRAGEKPLYFSEVGEEVWFASEIQALLENPSLCRELDEEAVAAYLMLGYVPAPRTIFRDVRKVEPGTSLTFGRNGRSEIRYWDARALATNEAAGQGDVEELRRLLVEAVQRQMIADVDVGVFLSGGMDSALIASIASEHLGGKPLHTFTVRSTEASFDEGKSAAEHARRLGTRHHEVMVGEAELVSTLSEVVARLGEPLADPAILPTFLLAKKASEHVRVVLSGEGADELFGGYPTYLGHRCAESLLGLPSPIRSLAASLVDAMPASRQKVTIDYVLRRFFNGLERPWPARHFAWFGTGEVNGKLPSLLSSLGVVASGSGTATDAMLLDYLTYLPDDLLTKNDRATMMHSVEARSPFLDRTLSAYALGLREEDKVRGLQGKRALRTAARAWLPDSLLKRRKRGLSVPVADLLDRGLRSEVDRLLAPDRLLRQGFLDGSPVERILVEHRSRQVNHDRFLWAMVVLQVWIEHWVPEQLEGA